MFFWGEKDEFQSVPIEQEQPRGCNFTSASVILFVQNNDGWKWHLLHHQGFVSSERKWGIPADL